MNNKTALLILHSGVSELRKKQEGKALSKKEINGYLDLAKEILDFVVNNEIEKEIR